MNTSLSLNTEISRKFSCFMLGFILIVILFHSDFLYYYPLIEDLTVVSTTYFFCVSAFFFYTELNRKSFTHCLKKRCITLLVPYLLWNILYLLFSLKRVPITLPGIIRGFTISTFCTPSWYLMTLFLFFLIAPPVRYALQKKSTTLLLLAIGSLLSYLGYIKFQKELASLPFIGAYLVRMSIYFTAYLFGSAISTWLRHKLHVTRTSFILGILSTCSIYILLQKELLLETRWILWMLLPLTLWHSIPEALFKPFSFSQFFTEPAFFLNMIHCYLLFIWQNITTKQEIITGKYLSALNIILTIITTYVLYYILKSLLPGALQYLVGKRNVKQKGL